MTKYYWHEKESKVNRLFFKKDDKWYLVNRYGNIAPALDNGWELVDFSKIRPATEEEIENIPGLETELAKYRFYKDLLS